MSSIPNAKYITITTTEILVGGKPATSYCGQEINRPSEAKCSLKTFRKRYPHVEEIHVLSSESGKKQNPQDNPSQKHGSVAWCRIVLSDGRASDWVKYYEYSSQENCAKCCARDCAVATWGYPTFRYKLVNTISKKPILDTHKMKKAKKSIRQTKSMFLQQHNQIKR